MKIRQQIYREQELGVNTHEIAVNMLAKQGSKTAAELAQLLGINQA